MGDIIFLEMNLRDIASGMIKEAFFGDDTRNYIRGVADSASRNIAQQAGYAAGNPWFGSPAEEQYYRHMYDGLNAILPERPEVRQARLAREAQAYRNSFIDPNTNLPLPQGWNWVDPEIARRFHIPRTARNVRFYRDAGGNLQVHSFTPTTREEIEKFRDIADRDTIASRFTNQRGDEYITRTNGKHEWTASQSDKNSPLHQMQNALRQYRTAHLINDLSPQEFLRQVQPSPYAEGSVIVNGRYIGGQTPEAQALNAQRLAYLSGDKNKIQFTPGKLTPTQVANWKQNYGLDNYVDNADDKAFIDAVKQLGVNVRNDEQIRKEQEAKFRAQHPEQVPSTGPGIPKNQYVHLETLPNGNKVWVNDGTGKTYENMGLGPNGRPNVGAPISRQQAAQQPPMSAVVPIARGVMQQRMQQRAQQAQRQAVAPNRQTMPANPSPAAAPSPNARIRTGGARGTVPARGRNRVATRGRSKK